QILNAAVGESLCKFNAVPSIDFDRDDDLPEIPAFVPDAGAMPDFSASSDYNPFQESASPGVSPQAMWQRSASHAVDDWDKLYKAFENSKEAVVHPDSDSLFVESRSTAGSDSDAIPSRINSGGSEPEPLPREDAASVTPKSTIQLNDRYIVTPTASGLLIIDKHRAHVRVLYESYVASCADAPIPAQKVMFPEAVNLTPARIAILNENKAEILNMGFELEAMTADTWVINGIPAGIDDCDNVQLLTSLLDDLQTGTDVTQRNVRQSIALHLAKAAAVNACRQLTESEVEHLLSSLFSLSTPAYTPDGNKVMAEISLAEIRSLF
ncbi:MAG: hypothetical protein K2J66_08475, partial [Muribaculaceae bacterium]|nr:hypothetical protein [Muribaculaceae bacterium]